MAHKVEVRWPDGHREFLGTAPNLSEVHTKWIHWLYKQSKAPDVYRCGLWANEQHLEFERVTKGTRYIWSYFPTDGWGWHLRVI